MVTLLIAGIIIIAVSTVVAIINIGWGIIQGDIKSSLVFVHVLCVIGEVVGWTIAAIAVIMIIVDALQKHGVI